MTEGEILYNMFCGDVPKGWVRVWIDDGQGGGEVTLERKTDERE
jgi:hypothetical protein